MPVRTRSWRRWLAGTAAAALAGAAAGLGFAPHHVFLLVPLAVAALTLLVTGRSAGAGFWLGAVLGTAFMLVLLPWVRVVGAYAWVPLAVAEGLFYGLAGWVTVLVRRLPAWPVWAACGWVAVEAARAAVPFGGFPWGRLSFAAEDTPVANAFGYVGAPGTTFLVALLGTTMAWSVLRLPRRPVRSLAGVAAALGLVCLPAVAGPPADGVAAGRPVTVAAVQGDVPGPGNNVLYDPRGLTENHVAGTVALADDVAAGVQPQPDFVVWPENSTAVDPFQDPVVNAGIERAVDAIGVPVLVGGLVDGGETELFNQGIVWDPETGPGETYTKQNPVPYGEFIPWRDQMPAWFLQAGRLDEIGRDMQPGDRTTPLDLAGVLAADAICFDIAYDGGLYAQQRNGAQLLVVQTSNASFIFTDQVEQQFAMTRLRAIEAGRWLVVASTNGLSGVISPDGTVVATAPALSAAVLVEEVDLVEGLTPGVRAGRWAGGAVAAVTLLGLALALARARRPGTMDTEPATTAPTPVDR